MHKFLYDGKCDNVTKIVSVSYLYDKKREEKELTDFKQLAKAYLRSGKARSVITIIGVAITVFVLYGGLNLAYSYLLTYRDKVRQEQDYEFIVLTQSKSEALNIAADKKIKKAYVGMYEKIDYEYAVDDDGSNYEEIKTVYKNALYATGDNPYRMQKRMEEICEKYQVEATINEDLASMYFQPCTYDDASSVFIFVLVILLISFIFAIFAVGMIRNSIQMFMMEQVKDYGILRCIGATKGQLGKVIYKMGLTLELAGIAIGVIAGGAFTWILGIFLSVDGGYHIVPLAPVLFCYLGDMYFVIRECSKLVTAMSPVQAVRGELRIKKEKFKARGRGIMGLLFGMEGEYARKSVLRNRGRFAKTVSAMSISIAAIIAVSSTMGILNNAISYIDSVSGEYQYKLVGHPSAFMTLEQAQSWLATPEQLRNISEMSCVKEARKVYTAEVYATDVLSLYSHTGKEYLEKTWHGQFLSEYYNMVEEHLSEGADSENNELDKKNMLCSDISMYGLDDNELKDMEKYLVDGTTQVSDNGVIMVVSASASIVDEDSLFPKYIHTGITDYKVGDTIELIDTQEMYELSQNHEGYDAAAAAYKHLLGEGKVHSYTIEGIVDLENNPVEGFEIYTSRKNFFAETGFDESSVSGMKYKMDTKNMTVAMMGELLYDNGSYVEMISPIIPMKNTNKFIVLLVIFIFTLSAVNIINSSAGNIHMRRKEFAQLRVIGMSRKKLIKTAMLEGVMALIPSYILGCGVGIAIYYMTYRLANIMIPQKFMPSVAGMVIGFGVTAVLILGSIYIPVIRLPKSMAEDLTIEE